MSAVLPFVPLISAVAGLASSFIGARDEKPQPVPQPQQQVAPVAEALPEVVPEIAPPEPEVAPTADDSARRLAAKRAAAARMNASSGRASTLLTQRNGPGGRARAMGSGTKLGS